MGLFKKRPPTAYNKLLVVCEVLGQAVGRCAIGELPLDYLDFTIENQAADFHSCYEAYVKEQGSVDRAWAAAEKQIYSTAKIWLDIHRIHFDKRLLKKKVTEVLIATMGAAAAQKAMES
jgi:hypothetical protein